MAAGGLLANSGPKMVPSEKSGRAQNGLVETARNSELVQPVQGREKSENRRVGSLIG